MITEYCNKISITYGSDRILLSGESGQQYFFKILKRFGDWSSVLNCTSSCGHEAEVGNLQAGNYQITVYNASWQQVCDGQIIELKENNFTQKTSYKTATPSINSLEKQSTNQNYSIYPNPAKQEVFINLNAYAGQQGSIQLINQFGQIAQQVDYDKIPAETLRMDLLKVQTGLHFINIQLANGTQITEKILIH